MRTAGVVIIGGGCVGTSVAYHLAVLGLSDVVLLDSGFLGGGSTAKAAGGIRLQHADELNMRIARRSLTEFLNFTELTGVPIGFKQVGYLFLLDSADGVARFRDAVRVQTANGIPSEVVDLDTVRELVPQVRTDDLVGATFCPSDGFAIPEAVVQGYARAARRLGVSIRTACPVTGIRVSGDRVAGVDTPDGPLSTRTVVCAAGVGSAELVRGTGFELPVHGEARTIYFSGANGRIPDGAPLTVDFASGFYFRREGQGLLFAGRQRRLDELAAPAVRRLPLIAELPIESSWWGYYDMSPDRNAMIGAAPVPGIYCATGFSGHGFQQSPAVGEHVAELIAGREPTLDLSAMSPDRFSAGLVREETFVI